MPAPVGLVRYNMTAKNEITGDLLKSKVSNKNFTKGFEGIDWSDKLDSPKPTTNKLVELWTEDDEKRQDIVGQNGPIGAHYDIDAAYQQVERDYADR